MHSFDSGSCYKKFYIFYNKKSAKRKDLKDTKARARTRLALGTLGFLLNAVGHFKINTIHSNFVVSNRPTYFHVPLIQKQKYKQFVVIILHLEYLFIEHVDLLQCPN